MTLERCVGGKLINVSLETEVTILAGDSLIKFVGKMSRV